MRTSLSTQIRRTNERNDADNLLPALSLIKSGCGRGRQGVRACLSAANWTPHSFSLSVSPTHNAALSVALWGSAVDPRHKKGDWWYYDLRELMYSPIKFHFSLATSQSGAGAGRERERERIQMKGWRKCMPVWVCVSVCLHLPVCLRQ